MQKFALFTNQSNAKQNWQMVSDQVMGGLSQGQMYLTEDGVNVQGQVSLENNGGFLQVQWLIDESLSSADLKNYEGIFIEWCAPKTEDLELLLKSSQLWMPWQSYRCKATITTDWQTLFIPFEAFEPYRTQTRLNPKRINKFAVLAGGKEMMVEFNIRQFGLYQ